MQKSSNKTTLVLIIIPFATFIANLDVSVVNIIFPTLMSDFKVSIDVVSWVALSYLLAFVSTLLFFGRLSDLKGTETIFKYGFLLFGIASLLCSISGNIYSLVGFRFLQGIGGAMILSSYAAVVIKNVPEKILGRTFGLGGVFGGIGFALGAPIGGFLVEYLDWRWVFYINVPLTVIAFILCNLYLKPHPVAIKQKMDFKGAILSFLMLSCFVLALSLINSEEILFSIKIGLFIGFLLFLILFIRVESRAKEPLLYLPIFKIKNLTYGLLSCMIVLILLGGFNFLFPFFFEKAYGLSTSETGLVLMSFPLLTIFLAPLSGSLCDKGYERIINISSVIIYAIALIGFIFFAPQTPLFIIIGILLVFGIGLSFFITANTTQIMNNAPKNREGLAGSLISGFSFIGTIIGISIFEIVFTMHQSSPLKPEEITDGFQHAVFLSWIIIIPAIYMAFFRKSKNSIKVK